MENGLEMACLEQPTTVFGKGGGVSEIRDKRDYGQGQRCLGKLSGLSLRV